jgi:hypothetical protein
MSESGMRCVTWAASDYRDIRRGYDNDKVKVKVKFTLELATKAQRVSRGIALLFL